MRRNTEIVDPSEWKPKILVVGAVLGALVGLGAAYLYTQRAEMENGYSVPEFSTGDGVRLGLLLLGLLRSVSDMASKEK
jgi:hypothetical protein